MQENLTPSDQVQAEELRRGEILAQINALKETMDSAFSGLEHPSTVQVNAASKRYTDAFLNVQRLQTVLNLSEITSVSVLILVERNQVELNLADQLVEAGNQTLARQLALDPKNFKDRFPDIVNHIEKQVQKMRYDARFNPANDKLMWQLWLGHLSTLKLE